MSSVYLHFMNTVFKPMHIEVFIILELLRFLLQNILIYECTCKNKCLYG